MSIELQKLIEALGEKNFKKVIRRFTKQYYDTKEVNIVDGPYDGGIDLVVYKDSREIKKSIQITIQKSSIEKKLFEDVQKAKENVTHHQYLNKLEFYVNSNITKSKKIKWEQRAEIEYGIDLKIYDASKLAEDAEEFDEIKKAIFEIYGGLGGDISKIDKETKVLFDMLSIGRETGEIKREFIKSFILLYLFENPNSTAGDVYKDLKEKLSEKYDEEFYLNQLNYLKSQNLLVTPTDTSVFKLSSKSYNKVKETLDFSTSQEKLLIRQIGKFLNKCGLKEHTNELIEKLKKIYLENYDVGVDDVLTTDSSYDKSLRKAYNSLLTFFRSKGIKDETNREKMTRELLDVCSTNDYLNKIGVSVMFTKLFKSNMLEVYLNQRDFHILLDTQIILRLLCVKYKDCDYPDFQYKSIRKLNDIFLKFSRILTLETTINYLEEVGGHILEALKIERFLSIPKIKKLGKSSNVFYNFYLYLEREGIVAKNSFRNFIHEITNVDDLPSITNPNFVDEIIFSLNPLLTYSKIAVINVPWYEDDYFFDLKKHYENSLSSLNLDRSPRARENDIIALAYLCSKSDHIDPKTNEPYNPFFITWDSIFHDIRMGIKNKMKGGVYSKWHNYTPPKFVDRLSVMNFEVNPESITYNLIALTESNFNNDQNENFVDVISSLFNTEDVSELSLAKKLIDLEEKVIFQDKKDDFREGFDITSPLTEILIYIRNYYYRRDSKYSFKNLVSLFEENSYSDEVIRLLQKNITYYNEYDKVDASIVEDMDKLISKKLNN